MKQATPPVVVTDSTPMPFGKYQGKPMIEVPAHYLLYLFDHGGTHHAGVNQYINENLDVLKKKQGGVINETET